MQHCETNNLTEDQTSYRQILKATSLFGGVQVFQILISIVRSKFIAVLLGPEGMGIAGLLTSTTSLISGITNFGLGTSAVRNVAEANGKGNTLRVSIVVTVLRRLVWITGSLGMLVTVVLAPWLSEITFGNRNYTIAFTWISAALLFNQLSTGQMVLLQGMQKLKDLARASLYGSILGLLISVPLYYLFGIDGIVPTIILSSITSLALSWYFSQKIKLQPVKVRKVRTIAEGKGMITMGFMISLSGLITLGVSYIVRIFISHTGGVDQVGLYNAGFAIINTYVGMIFTAMSTDYYPRLSAVAQSNEQCRQVINQQAEVALLILSPLIMAFLVFIKWVVILFYSTKFIAVNDMILWAAMGMFFKAASWSIAFIFLAKGASRLFFWNEFITNIYLLTINLIGYRYWGLAGMGLSYLITYLIYFVQVFLIARNKYQYSFTGGFYKIFVLQFIFALLCLLVVKLMHAPFRYISGSFLIAVSVMFSWREMDKRIDLKAIGTSLKNRFKSF